MFFVHFSCLTFETSVNTFGSKYILVKLCIFFKTIFNDKNLMIKYMHFYLKKSLSNFYSRQINYYNSLVTQKVKWACFPFGAFLKKTPVFKVSVSSSHVSIFFPFTVDSEQVSALGSEDDDEVGLWSLEPQDCHESLDKTSLTPSEVTEEPSSPAYSTRPPGLSPGSRICWGQVESEANFTSTDREGGHEPLRMYCKS